MQSKVELSNNMQNNANDLKISVFDNNDKENNYTLNTEKDYKNESNIINHNSTNKVDYAKKIKKIYSYIDNVYNDQVINSQKKWINLNN